MALWASGRSRDVSEALVALWSQVELFYVPKLKVF